MEIKYFMMSFRYNKKNPSDFDLQKSSQEDIYVYQQDNSLWKPIQLYDLGWGKENGYYRLPMLTFQQLFNLLVISDNQENKYGAAAVIMDNYNDELFETCIKLFSKNINLTKYINVFKILQLDLPLNRSSILNKNYSEIEADYKRWNGLTEKVKSIISSK